jgi:carbonic anhydrase
VPPLEREWATLRANVPPGSYVMVGHQQYNLLQFHFHTPSEHQVNGRAAPMEVHFVHLRDGALPCDADALLVIGAKIVHGARHAELDKIFGLPALPFDAASAPLTISDFDLTRVLPSLAASWRYPGSLTAPASFAPACSSAEGSVEEQLASGVFPENVQWVVLTRSIEMSREQIRRFRKLFEDGNSRQPQPIGSRQVWRDVPERIREAH